jgi:hypothetical protein
MDFDSIERDVHSKRLLVRFPAAITMGVFLSTMLIASSVFSVTSFSQGGPRRVGAQKLLETLGTPEPRVRPPGFDFVFWGASYDEPKGTCGSGTGMFFFSSDRIRFMMPPVGSGGPNQNFGGARGAPTDDKQRFIFELKSDSCIYRTSIEKLTKKNEEYKLVPFDSRPPPEVTTPALGVLNWAGTFADSDDTCASGTGMFYYSNDQIRFVMPFYDGGPNKNFGSYLGHATDGNEGYIMELRSDNCRYLITAEKLVKVDGDYQIVPVKRSIAPTKTPPP